MKRFIVFFVLSFGDILYGKNISDLLPEKKKYEVIYLNNISQLLSIDTKHKVDGNTIMVLEKRRGGLFKYESSKSKENNDGTIINGWVRQYAGPVNIDWYISDYKNATQGFQKALNYHNVIYIPSGEYVLDSLKILNKDISIHGDGDKSILKFTTSNNGIEVNQNSDYSTYISKIKILTTQKEAGDAIHIDYSSYKGELDRHSFFTKINDVTIKGIDRTKSGWRRGIYLNEASNTIVSNCFISGRIEKKHKVTNFWPGMLEGIGFYSTKDKAPVNPFFENNVIKYASVGYKFKGTIEGIRLNSCIAIACRDGVNDDRTEVTNMRKTIDPWIYIDNCHFNTSRFGVRSHRSYQSFITSSLFYQFNRYDEDYAAIYVSTGNNWLIKNNHITCEKNFLHKKIGIHIDNSNRSNISSNFVEFCQIPVLATDHYGGMIGTVFKDNSIKEITNIDQTVHYQGRVDPYLNPESNYRGIIAEGSNSNDQIVLNTKLTNIKTIKLKNAPSGSIFKIHLYIEAKKGETGGKIEFIISNDNRKAKAKFGFNAPNIKISNEEKANQVSYINESIIVKKITNGVLKIIIRGNSLGSNTIIDVNKFQYIVERIK